MNHYLIEIHWSDEDQGFIATVPDLPGCCAWGRSVADAAREIEDAQAAWIAACLSSGEPLPRPVARSRNAA